ncbi:NAD-dependent epimerase/dehydratase family protein [bacterium]|nr:NAD-dependent epimerase/dehydratase family protein [bacterium]
MGSGDVPSFPVRPIFLHLAGQTAGDAAALAENRRSTLALCKAAESTGAGHVFLMSSAAVYAPSALPITEAQPPDPVSDYGRAKLEAETVAQDLLPPERLTILRLGNLAGADALLSRAREGAVSLDPIDGQAGGPERSYIGPRALSLVLKGLVRRVLRGDVLPQVMNVAQPPALAMADLLRAAGADWRFGPPRASAIPRVELSVDLLAQLVEIPAASAAGVIKDLGSLQGLWP